MFDLSMRLCGMVKPILLALQVALYAHGIDEEPFSFASASPLGISFLWSASNIDVLSLVSVYEKVPSVFIVCRPVCYLLREVFRYQRLK